MAEQAPEDPTCIQEGETEPEQQSRQDACYQALYSEQFYLFSYKIVPCSKAYPHNWSTCPYVHPAEKARRRDPRQFNYKPLPCPYDRKGTNCPYKDDCEYTHNVYEFWLHPNRFRIQLCKDGNRCNRPLCFFAHGLQELRCPGTETLGGSRNSNSISHSSLMQANPAAAHVAAAGPGGGQAGMQNNALQTLHNFRMQHAAAAAAAAADGPGAATSPEQRIFVPAMPSPMRPGEVACRPGMQAQAYSGGGTIPGQQFGVQGQGFMADAGGVQPWVQQQQQQLHMVGQQQQAQLAAPQQQQLVVVTQQQMQQQLQQQQQAMQQQVQHQQGQLQMQLQQQQQQQMLSQEQLLSPNTGLNYISDPGTLAGGVGGFIQVPQQQPQWQQGMPSGALQHQLMLAREQQQQQHFSALQGATLTGGVASSANSLSTFPAAAAASALAGSSSGYALLSDVSPDLLQAANAAIMSGGNAATVILSGGNAPAAASGNTNNSSGQMQGMRAASMPTNAAAAAALQQQLQQMRLKYVHDL